jgi:hypothetical protein
MMMLGREIGLPAELMFGSPGNIGHPEGDQYVGELFFPIKHRTAAISVRLHRECIPLPSQSAEETARAAVNQFFFFQ